MTVYFYIPQKALNEATVYYTNIIEQAFKGGGLKVVRTNSLDFKLNHKEDLVFTIRVIDFLKVKLKYNTNRISIWFQGLLGEEYRMIHNSSFKSKITEKIFSFCEKYTLRKSNFSFFVSTYMKQYFEEKHQIVLTKDYLIMPCYNKNLNKKFFNVVKEKNTFVYAGTLFAWQCFEETVKLFKEIENNIPEAKFIVLTKEQEEAEDILERYRINNYEVKFVRLEDLDVELSRYEYGFLLREKHIVNQVSTPTKMNSYLAVGLRPIYTNVIDSFEKNLDLEQYAIKFSLDDNYKSIAKRIVENKSYDIDYQLFYEKCYDNFEQYYDDKFNIQRIEETLIFKILSCLN